MTPLPLPLALADELYRRGSTKTPRTVADELVRLTYEVDALRETLARCREMVGHPDNIAFIDTALAQGEKK